MTQNRRRSTTDKVIRCNAANIVGYLIQLQYNEAWL
jgi:hypothetical protein